MGSKTSAWEKAKKYGIDTTLIEANLKKTPTDRVKAAQELIDFMNTLRSSGENYYAKLRKVNNTPDK